MENAAIKAQIVRIAACSPKDRFTKLNTGLIPTLQNDPICKAFGINQIDNQSILLKATLLPPAKIEYGKQTVVEPGNCRTTINTFLTTCIYRSGRHLAAFQ